MQNQDEQVTCLYAWRSNNANPTFMSALDFRPEITNIQKRKRTEKKKELYVTLIKGTDQNSKVQSENWLQ